MRAVRSQQHGRAVCGQRPRGEKRVFSLVTFLAPAKKVTRDIQSRKLLILPTQQSTTSATLTPTLSRQRERGKIKSGISASAKTTIERAHSDLGLLQPRPPEI